MIEKLEKSEKIKKRRKDIYVHKIEGIISHLDALVKDQSVRISFEPVLVKWTQ